jgi:membrane protein YqaA with SNARE-associated domain
MTALISMFLSAFTSATLLPGSSELLFMALLNQGHEAFGILVFATIGNALGSMTSKCRAYF